MCGSVTVRRRGVCASENAGMSNELEGENPSRRMTQGSGVTFVFPGCVGTSGEADRRSRWLTG